MLFDECVLVIGDNCVGVEIGSELILDNGLHDFA